MCPWFLSSSMTKYDISSKEMQQYLVGTIKQLEGLKGVKYFQSLPLWFLSLIMTKYDIFAKMPN